MKPINIIQKLNESSTSNEAEAIYKRIEEIKKELDYCRKRDEVCLSLDGEEQVAELEAELEELENKLDELDESAGMVNESNDSDNLAQDLKSNYPNISEDKINEILTDVERLNETLGISGFFCKGHTTYVEGKEISVRFYTEENDMFILCYGYSAYDWELYFEGIINDKVTDIAKRVRQELNNGR